MNTDTYNHNFNKKLPFSVPEGYFDTLPRRIQENCTSAPEAKHTSWSVTLRSQLSFAAGFAILALFASLAFYFMRPFTNNQAIHQSIDYIEIVSRSIYNDYDFDHYKATEKRKHEIDSLNEFTNGMFLRYYVPNNRFSSITEDKRITNPQH